MRNKNLETKIIEKDPGKFWTSHLIDIFNDMGYKIDSFDDSIRKGRVYEMGKGKVTMLTNLETYEGRVELRRTITPPLFEISESVIICYDRFKERETLSDG